MIFAWSIQVQFENNRFVRLADRAASGGWTVERANVEIARLKTADMPNYVEMDQARQNLGSRELSFDVAAALDMLFDADVPGIPQDPDHNAGMIRYSLATAWLERLENGELGAADFIARHISLARKFYSTWEPIVTGAEGHPCWASIFELDARFLRAMATRKDRVVNLKRAIDLYERARPCYPPEKLSWHAFILEAMTLEELAEHEQRNLNLRRALELCDAARNCSNSRDRIKSPVIGVETSIWTRLIDKRLVRASDKERFEEFMDRSLAVTEPTSDMYRVLISLRPDFVNIVDSPWTLANVTRRVTHIIKRLIFD